MIRLLENVIRRVFIWWTIPLRIIKEIYLCLVDRPSPYTKAAVDGAGIANGDHAASNGSKDLSLDAEQKKFWEGVAAHEHWWGEHSPMRFLRTLNPIRTRLVGEAFLKDVMGLEMSWEETIKADAKFLHGARVCDVGCGGGLLTEALAEGGATVTGIDIIPSAIGIAVRHWAEMGHGPEEPKPEYICKSVEAFAADRANTYDVVICSEVLEHVTDPEVFALHCCKLVRPGGCIIFTTINRTIWSLLGLIIIPEDVLGLVPRFLHRLYMCVKPEEVENALRKMNFQVMKKLGLLPLPDGLTTQRVRWTTTPWTGMGFAMVAKRGE
ncbi:putative Ubiquinone biosynthesis O-methyltransferase [Hypsibius exemplaris]|uniref:Ubiquinone biosynthesis O-methyltransferase n=1 Tax=Hypsibius exemplaris TaxID=2072580 RepID=A0A1W0WU95_HYPEX|nr:putative Ubiquinone biosynthesis O-methyltransferase [Hypsibius exemplaris]